MPFFCAICEEESTRICARCTKDTCSSHICERCGKCSDCCECKLGLDEPVRPAMQSVAAARHEEPPPVPDADPEPPAAEPDPVPEPEPEGPAQL